MASSSIRRGNAKTIRPWTTTEEIALCKAWCEAMENYNAGDKRTGFWEVVFDNFKKEMGETIRKYDTVVVKWKEHQQLLLDEETLRETLEEEEAKAKKGRAKAEKEWEEFVKQEQAHDELFRLEFGVKSDSKYQTD
ncbi:hypothetical protein Tco_0465313 [Tanacetum coccineum]